MKKTLILSIFLISGTLQSMELANRWNYKFEKELIVNCQEDEYYCDDLCEQKESCIIKEEVCRDCIGSTPYLTHIFNQLGRSIVSSEIEALPQDLIELLKSGKFSTIGPNSIYNSVDNFNSIKISDKFNSLCPEVTNNPIVVFEKESISKLLGKPKYLVCNEKIFLMEASGGVNLLEIP